MHLLGFHTYINEMQGSRSKIIRIHIFTLYEKFHLTNRNCKHRNEHGCLSRMMPLLCDDIATHRNRHPLIVSSYPVAHSQQLYLNIIARLYQKQYYFITFIVELQKNKHNFVFSFSFIFPLSIYFSSCIPLACNRYVYTPVPSEVSHLPVCATV
jgi:hypothetical protein